MQSGVRNGKPSTEPFFHVSTSLFLGFLREKPQPASLCCAVGHLEGVSECNCQATSSTKIQPHYVPEERISKLQRQIKPNPIGTVVYSSARQCLITSCLIISRFCRFFLALFICAIHSRVRKTLQSQIRGLALFFPLRVRVSVIEFPPLQALKFCGDNHLIVPYIYLFLYFFNYFTLSLILTKRIMC